MCRLCPAVLGTSSLEWPLKYLLGDWLSELGSCLLQERRESLGERTCKMDAQEHKVYTGSLTVTSKLQDGCKSSPHPSLPQPTTKVTAGRKLESFAMPAIPPLHKGPSSPPCPQPQSHPCGQWRKARGRKQIAREWLCTWLEVLAFQRVLPKITSNSLVWDLESKVLLLWFMTQPKGM